MKQEQVRARPELPLVSPVAYVRTPHRTAPLRTPDLLTDD